MSASTATTIDEAVILATPQGTTLPIHPDDMRELQAGYCYSWPKNAPRDVFRGVRLSLDAQTDRLSRKPL